MSSGKKRVVKQPVPVSVAGGAAPPPLTSATPTSQAARPLTKSPQPVVPSQPKPKSTTTPPQSVRSSNPSKAAPPAAHPPIVVASQPLITAKSAVLDDFPPLPTKGSSPPTPKQSVPTSTDTSPSLSSTTPSTVPSRNLSDAAAAMIASNAQTRASKTQQLRDTLKKVQRDDVPPPGVLIVQGEESRGREGPSVIASHKRDGSDRDYPPPTSPTEGHSPLDLSTSHSFGAAYSPIHRRTNQTKDDQTDLDDTDLSVDMEDTVEGKSSNHSSSTTSPALPSSKFNRSLNNAINTTTNRMAAAGTFTASTQVQAGGLSEKELASILAVAEDPNNRGDAVSKAAYLNVCRHLVRLQTVMNEREADLRMAGELGEAICAENGKLEAIVEELTSSLDSQVEETKRLEEAKAHLSEKITELTQSNQQMASETMAQQVDSDFQEEGEGGEGGKLKRKKGREDSASTALGEFIRSELSTNLLNTSLDASFDAAGATLAPPVPASPSSKPIKYTGNLIIDLTNLQRKLRRERRMWDRNLQAMEQSLQIKEKERAQLAADKLRLEQEMETFRALQSQLLKKNTEWEEKEEALRVREEKLQHDTKIKISTQRKSLEMEVQGREEELRREKEEREKEGKRRAELEGQVRELKLRIEELNHQIELWSEEKAREQATRQSLEAKVEKLTGEVKQAKEETQKKGKQVQAAEKIVGQSEKGKEAEERRAREIEQKVVVLEQQREELENALIVAEAKLAEEERRRAAAEGELQKAHAAVNELKEQLHREEAEQQKAQATVKQLQEQLRREEGEQQKAQAAVNQLKEQLRREEAEQQKAQASVAQLKDQLRREKASYEKELSTASAQPSIITAESTAALATPHAAVIKKDSATQSDSKEVATIGTAAALSPMSSPALSQASAPMWVLPQPSFSVNVKDQALLTAMFSYLSHQWTIALLLLVSNSRVKKTVEWIKDSQSTECLSCHKEFGILFNRRHHCRLCGGLYCADCANLSVDLEKFGLEDVRVCSACFGVVGVLTHGQSLMVNKTKVNQKVKEGKKTKGGAKVKEIPALPAPAAPTPTTRASRPPKPP